MILGSSLDSQEIKKNSKSTYVDKLKWVSTVYKNNINDKIYINIIRKIEYILKFIRKIE